jgi:hypothetical protein
VKQKTLPRKEVLSMTCLQQNPLNFNNNMSYDFNGDNLSSDAGLLAIRSFDEMLGLLNQLL